MTHRKTLNQINFTHAGMNSWQPIEYFNDCLFFNYLTIILQNASCCGSSEKHGVVKIQIRKCFVWWFYPSTYCLDRFILKIDFSYPDFHLVVENAPKGSGTKISRCVKKLLTFEGQSR